MYVLLAKKQINAHVVGLEDRQMITRHYHAAEHDDSRFKFVVLAN